MRIVLESCDQWESKAGYKNDNRQQNDKFDTKKKLFSVDTD